MPPLQATTDNLRRLLRTRFLRVREASIDMCRGLDAAEFRMQPMEDVSPPWWNLGHTSWFFARNLLAENGGERDSRDADYDYLLNSYYQSLGARLPRNKRGSVTRPATEEIYDYRASVDRRVLRLIDASDDERLREFSSVLRIGIEHEQQHQELFYTEIKYILFQNPPDLRRAFRATDPLSDYSNNRASDEARHEFEGGLLDFGNVEGDWCWDNELPVHRQYLEPFAISERLVTNAEYLVFMADGGYRNPLLWLDNGWQQVQANAWQAPLYWEQRDDVWWHFTMAGMQRVNAAAPVSHVSFYEADAFARWKSEAFASHRGARLPSEREWEHAARSSARLSGLHRTLWQWTASYYEPYPGYQPFPGALAEYNGKFMDNQRVLRGGSFATPEDHYRLSYRNFWPAATRFQFTGILLAFDGR